MKPISPFKIILIAVFLFSTVLAVAVFAGFGGVKTEATPTATIWGTIPTSVVQEVVRRVNEQKTIIDVIYEQKNPETFHEDFVEALARDEGPDLVILSDDQLYEEKNKLVPIGYQTFPEREFRETFTDLANILITDQGVLGVPLVVDPMVMYWNRDIFAEAAISTPPKTWAELPGVASKIIKRETDSRIIEALVPFGEYRNVSNAKQILATLAFQIGNPLYGVDSSTGEVQSLLDTRPIGSDAPSFQDVVEFFTEFSNPQRSTYTWNRSMPKSQDVFLAGDLAMYFAPASEIYELRDKNPNLNFETALIPKASGAGAQSRVYGRFHGLYIVKGTKNVNSALAVLSLLSTNSSSKIFADAIGLPSARRDLLVTTGESAYKSVFVESAIQSKTWFDPESKVSNNIFLNMIESITTGREGVSDALSTARLRLDQVYRDNQ